MKQSLNVQWWRVTKKILSSITQTDRLLDKNKLNDDEWDIIYGAGTGDVQPSTKYVKKNNVIKYL